MRLEDQEGTCQLPHHWSLREAKLSENNGTASMLGQNTAPSTLMPNQQNKKAQRSPHITTPELDTAADSISRYL